MTRERRTNQKPVPSEVKKYLNNQQLATFRQSHYFDWQLAFVRRPLFQEPIVVVYNNKFGMIGVLDQDGQINMESGLDFRDTGLAEPPVSETVSWTEKRKDTALEQGDLELILTERQFNQLDKIEIFGWRLKFVRQPVLQHAVPVIVSPKGDKFATLELNGRIKVLPQVEARKEDFCKESDAGQLTMTEDKVVV